MKDIHIAFCLDRNYLKYMVVAAHSIADKHVSTGQLILHLVHKDFTEQDKELIKNELNKDFIIYFYDGSSIDFNLQGDNNRYGLAALYRLSLDQLLPKNIKKVIYLDCDVLVTGDLAELWKINIESYILAAVVNLCSKASKEVNLQPEDYFNSGVLLINIELWRKESVSHQVLEYMRKHYDKLKCLDQSALNVVTLKKWLRLSLNWNVQSDVYAYTEKRKINHFYDDLEVKDALVNSKIIHFTGPKKPWHYYSFHPCKKAYKNYYKGIFGMSDPNFYSDKSSYVIIKKLFQFKRNLKMFLNRIKFPIR